MKHQHLPPWRSVHRLSAVAVTGGMAVLLAACGGGSPGGQVTVTVTPTVTATPAGSGHARSSSSTSAAKRPTSDDKGRTYDFGEVVKASTVRGVPVLELDRYTWKGLDDARLAQQGVPITPFTGPVPYENQNTKLTYTLPVAAGARLLYHHCIAPDQPLQTKSVTPAELLGLADRENTVLVKLDEAGQVVAADNIAGCPG